MNNNGQLKEYKIHGSASDQHGKQSRCRLILNHMGAGDSQHKNA